MKRVLLISLLLVLGLVGWNTVCADDGFYVIPTMKQKYAPVPATGSWSAGTAAFHDDGYLDMGVAEPTPRFVNNNNNTVTDKLTGLIWMSNARVITARSWSDAIAAANNLYSGQFSTGPKDGSRAGDWRLPNVRELQSMVDYGKVSPAFPLAEAEVFYGRPLYTYWSSTTFAGPPLTSGEPLAWAVGFEDGRVSTLGKTNNACQVWCVRGGKSVGRGLIPAGEVR